MTVDTRCKLSLWNPESYEVFLFFLHVHADIALREQCCQLRGGCKRHSPHSCNLNIIRSRLSLLVSESAQQIGTFFVLEDWLCATFSLNSRNGSN